MGIRHKCIKYFKEITELMRFKTFEGLRMVQFGDLMIRKEACKYLYPEKSYDFLWSSQYFHTIGFDVTTIDLSIGTESVQKNTLNLDLSEPITGMDPFDFVLDFGTGEHIKNQYQLFKNMHDLCKINGIIMRCNPSEHHEMHHGIYEYTLDFYQDFILGCHSYKPIDVRIMPSKYWHKHVTFRNNLYISMLKTKNWFLPKDNFDEIAKKLKTVTRGTN